jgi:hypothetical protein
VGNKQIHVVSQSFEIAIVAIGVAAECDADIVELHSIGDCRHTSMNYLLAKTRVPPVS